MSASLGESALLNLVDENPDLPFSFGSLLGTTDAKEDESKPDVSAMAVEPVMSDVPLMKPPMNHRLVAQLPK